MSKTTPLITEWTGGFPWSTYGGKPILNLHGEPLYEGSSLCLGSRRPKDGAASG